MKVVVGGNVGKAFGCSTLIDDVEVRRTLSTVLKDNFDTADQPTPSSRVCAAGIRAVTENPPVGTFSVCGARIVPAELSAE